MSTIVEGAAAPRAGAVPRRRHGFAACTGAASSGSSPSPRSSRASSRSTSMVLRLNVELDELRPHARGAEGGDRHTSAQLSRPPRTSGSSDDAVTKLGLVQHDPNETTYGAAGRPVSDRRANTRIRATRPALRRASSPSRSAGPRGSRWSTAPATRRWRRGSIARRSRSRPAAARSTTAPATPLAIGEQATTVYADPRHVVARAKAAVKAGETLGLDPDELYPSLRDRTKRFVFVDRKADPVKAAALQKMGVSGFGFYPEEHRILPAGRGRLAPARVRRHGQQGTGRARAHPGQDAARPTRATRSSCATRPATRSTSSRRARSGPAGTSS